MSDLQRTLAQFFFEVGYGSCWAEAFAKNGEGPFPLTDVIVERAWDNARDAHEDPVEFDANQRTADLAPEMAARIERLEAINAELLEALTGVTELLVATVAEFGCWSAEEHPKVIAARASIASAQRIIGEGEQP